MPYLKKYIFILCIIISILIETKIIYSLGTIDGTNNIHFIDLPMDEWYYPSVIDMAARNVISGYPDGKFRPKNIITRAEFASIMVKALGITIDTNVSLSSTSIFTDVSPEDWFFPFVEASKPFLIGYREPDNRITYRPKNPVLREDMTVAIVKMKAYDTTAVDESVLDVMFKDSNSISKHARRYVAIATSKGLISGYPDETFKAQGYLTRAEACYMLWESISLGSDNKIIIGDIY